MLKRVRGAYLGLAIGDALGASVEFMTPREIRASHGLHADLLGGGWLRLKPGQVTDDTEMSLALGQSILSHGGVNAEAAARAFSDWMHGQPVDVGHTVRRGIIRFRRNGQACVPPEEFGAGNGAAMRCLPVAIATLGQGADRVRDAVLGQAHVTHNNTLSDAACLFLVQLVQMALSGMDRARLQQAAKRFVDRQPQFAFERRRMENPGGFIVDTLQAVLQAMFDHHDFRGCLVDVVNRGGDADTTGAILGMIAGAHYGEMAIPRPWLKRLDPQVRQACVAQAEDLLDLARSGRSDR